MTEGWPRDALEAIDHYREGLYRIARGEPDAVGIALVYLGEDQLGEEAPPASPSIINPP